MNRVTGDTREIRDFMENTFTGMFTYIITFIGALVIMLSMNVRLTLISMIFVPLMWILHKLFLGQDTPNFFQSAQERGQFQFPPSGCYPGNENRQVLRKENTRPRTSTALRGENAEIQEKNEVFWAKFQPFLGFVFKLRNPCRALFRRSRFLKGNRLFGGRNGSVCGLFEYAVRTSRVVYLAAQTSYAP